MSTALATLAGKLAERVGMDSVDPQELITTLRQTAFKGDASDAQFIALLIVANQYGLNPWTKEIYAFPDKQNGIVPVVKPDAAIQSGSKWGTAEDLTAAEWMFDMVKTIAPSARKPNFAGWANDIRLMRERDGRNHRDMCVLFRWACQDNFWSGNVLSPAKLRDKWTQLEINRNKQQAGVTAGKSKLDLTNTDWIYGVDL